MKADKTKNQRGNAPGAPNVPLSVCADAEENVAALLDALPAHSEVLGTGEILRERYPDLCFDAAQPHGRYVLFAGAGRFDPAAAEDFCKRLCEREEEAIFYPSAYAAQERGEPREILPFDPVLALSDRFAPRQWCCAVSADLYTRIRPLLQDLAPERGIPLLAAALSSSAAITREALFMDRVPCPQEFPNFAQVCAYVQCFKAIKGTLTAGRYRFAFEYVCGRIVAAHAVLAKAHDRAGLSQLDEYLKKENMALRVAAAERAPLNFIDSLRRHDFKTKIGMLPALWATLAAEKKQ